MARGSLLVVCACALLATVAAAGCGGSKSPREEYASKLNAMCEDFAEREQEIGAPTSPSDLAARGERIVTAFREAILSPIRRLEAPAEIEPQAARLRELARQQYDILRGLAAAAEAGDLGKLRRLVARNSTLNGQAGEIARQLEARSCSG